MQNALRACRSGRLAQEKGAAMKIPVIYMDGTHGAVNNDELEELLQNEALLSFRRSCGWVRLGVDELRNRSCTNSSSWRDRKKTVIVVNGSRAVH